MRLTEGTAGARILAFGGYQPARVVTNDEIAEQVDTSDEWIRSRVGIASRRIAAPDETVADMAAAAGGKALAASGLSPVRHRPGHRGHLHARGADPEHGRHRRDPARHRGARRVRPQRRLRRVLLRAGHRQRRGPRGHLPARAGDRRRETVPVGRLDRPLHLHHLRGRRRGRGGRPGPSRRAAGIGPVVWGSAGDLADKISIEDRHSFIFQEGQAVFRWATTALHPVALKACERAGVAPADLAAFVPHQANLRIIEAIAQQDRRPAGAGRQRHRHRGQHLVGVHPARPVEDARARRASARAPSVLLLGFGAGISYAAQVITVP